MRYVGSELSSIFSLLTRWRSSVNEKAPRLAEALRGEAQRCFRLAQGIASFELADELEAIGRAFDSEADELETGMAPGWPTIGLAEELIAAE